MQILSVTLPIFACIGIGYVAVLGGVFTREDMSVLGRYVLNIGLPAVMFGAVAGRDLGEVLQPAYMAVYAIGTVLTIGAGYAWLALRGATALGRAVGVMGMSCPNSGFIGFPLLLLAYPDLATVAIAMNFLVENFLVIPLCLVLIELAAPRGRGRVLVLLGQVLLSVVRRPFVLALIGGVLFTLTGLPLPDGAERLVSLLAASTAAPALISIGGVLAGAPLGRSLLPAGRIALGKLLLQPALVALTVVIAPILGIARLDPELTEMVILSAAVPMITIYPILVRSHGEEALASVAMVIATTLSFVTLTALIASMS